MPEITVYSDRHISHLVVTWVLMMPLLYFASQGSFWFQNAASNNAQSGGFNSLAVISQTREHTAVALMVFVMALVPIFSSLKNLNNVVKTNKIFVILVLWAIVSSAWSQSPIHSFEFSLCLAANTLFAFYLYSRFGHKQLLKLLLLLGWVCIISSIILSLFFPQYGIDRTGLSGEWKGMYVTKNICSIMTIFLLPGALCTSSTTLVTRIFRILYVGLSAFLVLMTQSATGKIALVALLCYIVFARFFVAFRKRDRAAIFITGVVIVVLLIITGITYSNNISYYLGKDPTLSGRTEIWTFALTSLEKRPMLGYGYMAFWRGLQGESAYASLVEGWTISSAHNGFLGIWLTLGAIGLGLVLYSLVRALKNAALCINAEESPYSNWCICIIILTVIIAIDEEQMMVPNDLTWILYILACIGLSEDARRIRLERNHG